MDENLQKALDNLDPLVQKNVLAWLKGPYDQKTKKQIEHDLLLSSDSITKAFYQKLQFGTGGIRAIMGVGPNRLNIYTIQFIAQGLANYLKKQEKKPKVLIGFDNRNLSTLFAEETAKVLAANEISVYLFNELRPTPMVSFGCRYKKCSAGIMITASHNTPEYNGFKVFGKDGAQILSPHDKNLTEEINLIQSPLDVKTAEISSPFIKKISEEIDRAYLKNLKTVSFNMKENRSSKKNLSIIYSNLHGAGITMVPKALASWGFKNIHYVEKQKPTDGNFPEAPDPNPEEKATLLPGIRLLEEKQADLFLANDPDSDRVGAVVLHQGQHHILSGHDLACLLVWYICKKRQELKKLPKHAACVKTIVTTELFSKIAKTFSCASFNVLTGFKYIGEKIREWDESKKHEFIFGAEESCSYLAETFCRDKDGISAACLIAEMALFAKKQNKTLVDLLYEIYNTYGLYQSMTFSLDFEEGEKGKEKMQSLLHKCRKFPPNQINNIPVLKIEDYLSREGLNVSEKTIYPLFLPTSNVLCFLLKDGSKIVVRPSGTEPKFKIYIEVLEECFSSVVEGIEEAQKRLKELFFAMETFWFS